MWTLTRGGMFGRAFVALAGSDGIALSSERRYARKHSFENRGEVDEKW